MIGSDGALRMYMYGYIYKDKFNPFDPSVNQINNNHNELCSGNFRISVYLEKRTTYILVVTTYHPDKIGPFSIIAIGPHNITLKQHSKYPMGFSTRRVVLDRYENMKYCLFFVSNMRNKYFYCFINLFRCNSR